MPKYLFVLLNEINAVDYSGEWIGVAYISAYLKKNKLVDIDFITTSKDNIQDVLKKCREFNPNFIGIPTLTFNYFDVKRLVSSIKKEFANTHIMLGHREATKLKTRILEEIEADSCVIGEGEVTTAELISAVSNHTELGKVKGICYRDNEGAIIETEMRLDVSELDSLPFPDREIFTKGKYHNHVHYVISTRGCKGNCSFCDIASDLDRKKAIYSRSMGNILDEIQEILQKQSSSFIAFGDDSFEDGNVIRNMRYKELYEGILDRKLKFNFSFNARAESIKEDSIPYLLKLKSVGLDKIFIGIDAGNEEDLRLYRKRASLEDNKKAITLLHKAEIPFDYGFIMFNPYTTTDNLIKNIDFIETNHMDIKSHVLSHRFVLYTGAPMLSNVKRDNLLVEKEFIDRDPFCYNFKHSYIEDIWNVLHPFRDWPANRDTISMVEGFLHSLMRDQTIDSVDDFKKQYAEYIRVSRSVFIKIFRYTIDAILAGEKLSCEIINQKFKDELDNVNLLWDYTYIANIKHGILIEKQKKKVN